MFCLQRKNRHRTLNCKLPGPICEGLIRVMLFKRFESSVYAFRKPFERLERIHDVFLKSLDQGFVPAGQDAQKLLYDSENYDEPDLLVALQGLSGKYSLSDFDEAKLRNHLEEDKNFSETCYKLYRNKRFHLQRTISCKL